MPRRITATMLNANVTVNLLYCDIFHNKFNKFNKTGVRMLDSIYQKMTLK